MQKNGLGYLGPQGTFSEEAALIYNRARLMELVEYPTIGAVISAVLSGELSQGLVPLDNTLEGGIAATLDHLARLEGIYICAELIYPIRQCLMAAHKVPLSAIKQVFSHPHALGQCAGYLAENLPRAQSVAVESTAAAAREVAHHRGAAAIASCRAAELLGLELLAEGIEDASGNATRFAALSLTDHQPTGDDKTSLVLTIPDGPGSLYRILGYFAQRGINLTRIESRPSRQFIGDWLFFIDCEGHRLESDMSELWKEIEEAVPFFKLLGSYPKAHKPES